MPLHHSHCRGHLVRAAAFVVVAVDDPAAAAAVAAPSPLKGRARLAQGGSTTHPSPSSPMIPARSGAAPSARIASAGAEHPPAAAPGPRAPPLRPQGAASTQIRRVPRPPDHRSTRRAASGRLRHLRRPVIAPPPPPPPTPPSSSSSSSSLIANMDMAKAPPSDWSTAFGSASLSLPPPQRSR